MIRFTDETIDKARDAYWDAPSHQNAPAHKRPDWRAAAAVLERAANAQVAAGKGWQVPTEDEIRRGIEDIVAGCARGKSPNPDQNTRDCVEAATATAPFDAMHTPWTSDETNRLKAVLNDAFAPAPEPFQVGKRYRDG